MVLIISDIISERLIYICDFVFSKHGIEYELTNDRFYFNRFSGSKITYSKTSFENNLNIVPCTLLFEENIRKDISLENSVWLEEEWLKIDGIIDPFSAIFYILTSYHEYIIFARDKHDRFEAKNHILFQYNWLKKQMVERWIYKLIEHFIPEKLIELKGNQKVQFIPSFDIDNTFAHQWKEGWRSILSKGKDTFQRNKIRLEERKKVLISEEKDPYDSYEYLEKVCIQFPETRFFWLLGDFSRYDKNISWQDVRHQRLIFKFSKLGKVGLHPSYSSNVHGDKLKIEKNRIDKIVNENVEESRQHFLKLQLPFTYRKLIETGFKKDFSMGFADAIGFRAGTSKPYFFFDLEKNVTTDLLIFPFVYMDGTLNQYLKLSPKEAMNEIAELVNEVKLFGGNFIPIWHNESIAEAGIWKDWKQVYEFTQKMFE